MFMNIIISQAKLNLQKQTRYFKAWGTLLM